MAPLWLEKLCRHVASMDVADITLADLAKLVELTPRALQYAFKQHLNTTPMRWVRQQRLQRVNADLKARSPSINVTQAAIASGFNNLGVFARYYQEAFAEKPSETLRSL